MLIYVLIGLFILGILGWAIAMTLFWIKCEQQNQDNVQGIVVECKVAIIGSGFAGSYAAYSLGPEYNSDLCLIEKLDRDGGRVFDVAEYEGGPVFGVGALRVISKQKTMLALARELNIVLEQAETDNELLKVRGQYFYRDVSGNVSESSYMCKAAFHNVTCYNNTDTDKAMLQKLLDFYHQYPVLAGKHPDFPTYILSMFGDEGLAFIRESVRYNSPFTSVSTQGVLDFFTNELSGMGLDPERSYPKGGMSEYINKMLARANQNGVRIFRNETVLQIQSDNKKFYIKTPNYLFQAGRVLSSIDPLSFKDVTGNIAETIKSAPEFQVINPKSLAIVTAWWPYRWWEESEWNKNATLSRVVSHENCFNTMDIPTFPYGRDQNVTRAVYDDGACVNTWKTLTSSSSSNDDDMLANEVVSSLQNVFTDVKVPQPRYVHGKKCDKH